MKKWINIVSALVITAVVATIAYEARTIYACNKVIEAAEQKQNEYFKRYDEECMKHVEGNSEEYAKCVTELIIDLNNTVEEMQASLEQLGCVDEN